MRVSEGQHVDSKNIRKHKNDVFRLSELLSSKQKPIENVSVTVKSDMKQFIDRMHDEETDVKQLGIVNKSKNDILDELSDLYSL